MLMGARVRPLAALIAIQPMCSGPIDCAKKTREANKGGQVPFTCLARARFALVIEDARVEASGVQVAAGVKLVRLRVVTHTVQGLRRRGLP
jgi:hypothetical protein